MSTLIKSIGGLQNSVDGVATMLRAAKGAQMPLVAFIPPQ
jgi:hypothetical protein